MFTEIDIMREASTAVCQRGRQLYMGGNVQTIQILDSSSTDTKNVRIKSFVQGSTWKCYNVDILVNEEDGIVENCKCECPAAQKYNGLCKHAVATLYRYIKVKKDQEKKNQEQVKKITVEIPDRTKIREANQEYAAAYGKTQNNTIGMPKTDLTLYHILMQNGKARQMQLRQNEVKEKVKLEAYYTDYRGKATVNFKIGTAQMYVLKDVTEFVSLLETNEKKSYGAKLEFYHHISAFDDESIPLVKFLQNCVNDFKATGGMNVYQYYIKNETRREIPLIRKHLDEFMEIMLGKQFYVTLNNEKAAQKYMITDDVWKMPLQIEGTAAGVRLKTPYIETAKGAAYQYIYENSTRKIHRIPLEKFEELQKFLEYMNEQEGENVFIAESELPVFCQAMLPELEKFYEVKLVEFSPEKYIPDKVLYEIYLDMPLPNRITCKLYAVYENEKIQILWSDAGTDLMKENVTILHKRDIQSEMLSDVMISQIFTTVDFEEKCRSLIADEDGIYEFLSEDINKLNEIGEVYISDKMKQMPVRKAPQFSMGISLKSDLLELNLESDEIPVEKLVDILLMYDRKKKFYRLKDGSFIDMSDEKMTNLINLIDGFGLTYRHLHKGKIELPKYRALYMDKLAQEKEAAYMHTDDSFKKLIENMDFEFQKSYDVPNALDGIMRNYQKTGFKWLKTLHVNGFGGILADDMGLGKTLQIISFLQSEICENENSDSDENKRTLIVCPASLVYNWASEIEKFAPKLHAVVIAGTAANRKALVQDSENQDILITSYDLLKRDIENYENVDFFCEIIDEAQFIKNHTTQVSKAVKMVNARTRFALTGTPMENRLSELWSIFDYLMPGFLYTYKRFKEDFESPIVEHGDEAAMQKLRKHITPFVLRRLKKDVLTDLPEKIEEVVYAKMEDKQHEIYMANVWRMRTELERQTEAEFKGSKIQILSELTRLRQICCNPSLIYDNYDGGAAKVDMCMELVKNAIESGHKILIFSQFTSMLDLLIKEARWQNISFYKLTGQTSKEERARLVEAFNNDDTSVFFISLKAGGTGLNLTSADIVIHFDPWWNVAAQNQATDRTHRIGQKNVVTVYKLIAKHTIEEKIVKMQEMKQELADQVLSGENMDKAAFSREELLELLEE